MSFDGIAPFYRALESVVFGNALQRARTAFISELSKCRHALLVGEGNGRFLSELVATNREVRVTCVEQRAVMIELARQRIYDLKQNARVHFIDADIRDLELSPEFDLIVTNFFLDCFDETEMPLVVVKLAAAAATDARWIVTEFAIPRRGFVGIWSGALVSAMYFFFRAVTRISASRLPDYKSALGQHGFRIADARSFVFGVVRVELFEHREKFTQA